jgi:hypothetical protein
MINIFSKLKVVLALVGSSAGTQKPDGSQPKRKIENKNLKKALNKYFTHKYISLLQIG